MQMDADGAREEEMARAYQGAWLYDAACGYAWAHHVQPDACVKAPGNAPGIRLLESPWWGPASGSFLSQADMFLAKGNGF